MDHQICVACSRKQRKGKRSCDCGHVLKEDIAIVTGHGKNVTGGSRLRAKRPSVGVDETTIDLLLENVLDQEGRLSPKLPCRPTKKPKPNYIPKDSSLKRSMMLYNMNTNKKDTIKTKIDKPRNKLLNSEMLNKRSKSLTKAQDGGFLSFMNSNVNDELPEEQKTLCYPSALEDINQKLSKQNGICRMAYY